MATSNNQRTLNWLKKRGYRVANTEHWNQFVGPEVQKKDRFGNKYWARIGIRQDMFGIADFLAFHPKKRDHVFVQSCGQAFAAHHRKIIASEIALEWLRTGGKILLIGWRKLKVKRGQKRLKWTPRIKWYSIDDFIKWI